MKYTFLAYHYLIGSQAGLAGYTNQIEGRLTLLPKTIHKKRKVINDDF